MDIRIIPDRGGHEKHRSDANESAPPHNSCAKAKFFEEFQAYFGVLDTWMYKHYRSGMFVCASTNANRSPSTFAFVENSATAEAVVNGNMFGIFSKGSRSKLRKRCKTTAPATMTGPTIMARHPPGALGAGEESSRWLPP